MTSQRTVSKTEVREHLKRMLSRDSVANVARAIGMTPRSVHRLMREDGRVYATTAEHIAFIAGDAMGDERIENAEVVEYAKTEAGRSFIAKCRASKPGQVMV